MKRCLHIALIVIIVGTSKYLALGQKKLTSIPFFLADNKNVISAEIEGKDSLMFVFDSGAALTVIDSATAMNLGFIPEKRIISGMYTEYFIPEIEISLSSFFLGNIEVRVSEFSKDMIVDGASVLGVIGSDILSEYITEVHYDDMSISLWDSFPDNKSSVYPMNPHPVFASIECAITLSNGDTLSGDFIIDSGAPVALIFNTPFVKKHNLIELCDAKTEVSIHNAHRKFKALHTKVSSVYFCNHSFNEVPIMLSQSSSGFLSISRYSGLIGNEILRRFNIIWDYKNNRLALSPSRFYNDKMPPIKN